MLNQFHKIDEYLRKMGIVRWVKRGSSRVWPLLPAAESDSADAYFSVNTPNGVLTLVSHVAGQTATLQKQLWKNICDALRYVQIDRASMTSDFFLVFGEDVANRVQAPSIQVTYSLAELVEQPQYKVEVWDVIKNKNIGS